VKIVIFYWGQSITVHVNVSSRKSFSAFLSLEKSLASPAEFNSWY
jgi:hypothetical protein